MARIHVVMPDDLIEEIDRLVGRRKRSSFISEAVGNRTRQEKLLSVLHETAGTLDMSRHPEWETTEKVAQWARELRDTPSIRGEPIERVPAGRKRVDRVAEGEPRGRRPVR